MEVIPSVWQICSALLASVKREPLIEQRMHRGAWATVRIDLPEKRLALPIALCLQRGIRAAGMHFTSRMGIRFRRKNPLGCFSADEELVGDVTTDRVALVFSLAWVSLCGGSADRG